MITRLQIDRVASLCKVDLRPDCVNLVVGENGTGKSMLAFALDSAVQLARNGEATGELFGPHLRYPWVEGPIEIELELREGGVQFRYVVTAPMEGEDRAGRHPSEQLWRDGELIYDNRSSKVAWRAQDGTMPVPWVPARGGSLLAGLDESGWMDGRPFLEAIRRIGWYWVNTVDLLSEAEERHDELDPWLSNFAAWLRGLHERSPEVMPQIHDEIRAFVPDFVALHLSGDPPDLHVELSGPPDTTHRMLPFNLLSQGHQRLVLLSFLTFGLVQPGAVVWLDEPCSDLHPPTARVWLTLLAERAREVGAQVFVATNLEHAEAALRPDRVFLLSRGPDGRSRLRATVGGIDRSG